MKVARPFKSERVTNTTGILMMLEVILKFFRVFDLGSFAVFEAVRGAGGGRHKVAKVRVERVIIESNDGVWAEAGSRATVGVVSENDSGGAWFERIESMYPSSRLCKFVSQNI
jgi:hypothetical protein